MSYTNIRRDYNNIFFPENDTFLTYYYVFVATTFNLWHGDWSRQKCSDYHANYTHVVLWLIYLTTALDSTLCIYGWRALRCIRSLLCINQVARFISVDLINFVNVCYWKPLVHGRTGEHRVPYSVRADPVARRAPSCPAVLRSIIITDPKTTKLILP